VELTPFRIALAYTVFGMVALFGSDVFFVQYVSEPLLSQIQALKGGVEVLLSAVLIFVLVNRREAQLQRATDRVTQQRQELEVLHRVLRHNLRNDLNIVLGVSQRIQQQDTTEQFTQPCETLRDTAEQILHYTEQAKRIKRIGERNGQVQTVDAADMVTELAAEQSREHNEVHISTVLPDRALVEVNPMFRGALEELILNAIEHNDSDRPEVTIEVRLEDGPSHMVEIEITDNGPQIPESELKPLRKGTEEQILHLSGMGLWFVKWTILHSNGEFTFENRGSRGTSVLIRVPRAPEELSATLSSLNAD
jgi:signal transduction histidine kinase